MKKLIFLWLILTSFIFSQKYFLPISVESSEGRPIKNANVDLYQSGSKILDLTWLDAGRYYWTDTSSIAAGEYDVYVNDVEWYSNLAIYYREVTNAVSMVTDTTALKVLSKAEGQAAYLKQLSSANTNGSGWFEVGSLSFCFR